MQDDFELMYRLGDDSVVVVIMEAHHLGIDLVVVDSVSV